MNCSLLLWFLLSFLVVDANAQVAIVQGPLNSTNLPGSDDIQLFVSSLQSRGSGPFSFQQAVTTKFEFISKDVFSILASLDSNPDDELLDPLSVGDPKLLALIVQARYALDGSADPSLVNDIRKNVESTISDLEKHIDSINNACIQSFINRVMASGTSALSTDVSYSFDRIMKTFRPESSKESIFDSINTLFSGMTANERETLNSAFESIKTSLKSIGPSGRQNLTMAIAEIHVAQDCLQELDNLTGKISSPVFAMGTGNVVYSAADRYLKAQILAFVAPKPSDYFIAALLSENMLKQQEFELILNGSLYWRTLWDSRTKIAKSSDNLHQKLFYYLKTYDSTFPIKNFPGNERISKFMQVRLHYEEGDYIPEADGVTDSVLDVLPLLSTHNLTQSSIFLYYSSVANQIRQENPDYLYRYYSTDSQAAIYTFSCVINYKATFQSGSDPKNLSDDDIAFLFSVIHDEQLDMADESDRQALEGRLFNRLYPEGMPSYIGNSITLTVKSNFDPTIGQKSNLGILAATANQAYREFDSNNRPKVYNPFHRAMSFGSRLRIRYYYRFSLDVKSSSSCFFGGCDLDTPPNLTQDHINFLNNYVNRNGLQNMEGQDYASQVLDAFKNAFPGFITSDSIFLKYTTTLDLVYADPSTLNYGKYWLSASTYNKACANSANVCVAPQISEVLGIPCMPNIPDLIPLATGVLDQIKSGVDVTFDDGGAAGTAVGILLPGFSILFGLGNKPELSNRQRFVHDWLANHGRSTEILDSSLKLARDQWKTKLISDASMFVLDVAMFAVPELKGLSAAVKAAQGSVRAAIKGGLKIIGKGILDASILINPQDIMGLAKLVRDKVSSILPKIPKRIKIVAPAPAVCRALQKRGVGACLPLTVPERIDSITLLNLKEGPVEVKYLAPDGDKFAFQTTGENPTLIYISSKPRSGELNVADFTITDGSKRIKRMLEEEAVVLIDGVQYSVFVKRQNDIPLPVSLNGRVPLRINDVAVVPVGEIATTDFSQVYLAQTVNPSMLVVNRLPDSELTGFRLGNGLAQQSSKIDIFKRLGLFIGETTYDGKTVVQIKYLPGVSYQKIVNDPHLANNLPQIHKSIEDAVVMYYSKGIVLNKVDYKNFLVDIRRNPQTGEFISSTAYTTEFEMASVYPCNSLAQCTRDYPSVFNPENSQLRVNRFDVQRVIIDGNTLALENNLLISGSFGDFYRTQTTPPKLIKISSYKTADEEAFRGAKNLGPSQELEAMKRLGLNFRIGSFDGRKVLQLDNIAGLPLKFMTKRINTLEEMKVVDDAIRSAVDKLHSKGIAHNSLFEGNNILIEPVFDSNGKLIRAEANIIDFDGATVLNCIDRASCSNLAPNAFAKDRQALDASTGNMNRHSRTKNSCSLLEKYGLVAKGSCMGVMETVVMNGKEVELVSKIDQGQFGVTYMSNESPPTVVKINRHTSEALKQFFKSRGLPEVSEEVDCLRELGELLDSARIIRNGQEFDVIKIKYYPGKSLRKWIEEDAIRLGDLDTIKDLAMKDMQRIHDKLVYHQDLHEGNILLDFERVDGRMQNAQLHIIDFGSSTILDNPEAKAFGNELREVEDLFEDIENDVPE